MKKILSILIMVCLTGSSFAAEVATVGSLSILGGQNKFQGETSSEMANINLNIVPSVKFSKETSLIPSYSLEYRVIKEAKELADGNILFQKGLNHNIYLKPIFTIGKDMKLKLKAGYMIQQLKEAESEDLSNGTFNYNKTTAGLEFAGASYSIGYNMYGVNFVNYTNVIDTTTASQIAGDPGKYILSFTAHEVMLTKKLALSPKAVLDTAFDYTIKTFTEQSKMTDYSVYSSDKRVDNIMFINLFPSVALIPTGPTTIFGGLNFSYVMNTSNQGAVDAAKKYISNYYNYTEYKIAPMINFSFNTVPLKATLIYEMGVRNYTDRLAQDINGNNLADKANITTSYASLNISYPVMENMDINLIPTFYTSSSNNKYESLYKYNYDTNSIFAGITYSYK